MSVQRGLPRELLGLQDVQLPPVEQYSIKVVPANVQSVVSSVQSTGTTAGIVPFNIPSQNIIFNIPAGQRGQWIDTSRSTLSFRAQFEVVSAGATVVTSDVNLRSHAMSFFSRMFHTSSTGQILDDVNLINLTEHQQNELNFDSASRDSMALPYGMLAEDSTGNSKNLNTGHAIANFSNKASGSVAIGSSFYSYEIPLPSSLIGKYANGFFPVGAVPKLDLTLTTDTIAPITFALTSAGTAATIRITLDLFSINLSYISLSPEASSLLPKTGFHVLSGVTQRVSSAIIPASTAGQTTILMGLKGTSCRSIITRFTENSGAVAGCPNGIFDSKLVPGNINYYINGVSRVPPNPLTTHLQPASVFMRLQRATDAYA